MPLHGSPWRSPVARSRLRPAGWPSRPPAQWSSARATRWCSRQPSRARLRDVDFLPLTVDVEERMYAAGKIPGSFFKREGRPGEKGTLTARMIDRPIRPLFPKEWRYDTQLVAIPLSIDHVHPYDILAMNGASAALMISDIPLPTPVGAVRIGKIDGNFVVNPSEEDLALPDAEVGHSDLDLIVAGTEEAILMVEAGANEIPEAEILDALDIAHAAIKKLCALQRDLAAKVGKEKKVFETIAGRPGAARADPLLARRGAGRGHAGRGQARAPGRHQGRRGGDPRAVRPAGAGGRLRGAAARRQGAPRGRPAGVRQAREVDHPRAHRRAQEASRRARRERDPRHLDRSRRDPAHARLGAVHARADAGAERRGDGHAQGGDAHRHARPGDQKVLLAPLQLPAVLGRGGGPHGRRQAPRHRPRRARRARARADGALDRGLPVLDPRGLGHPRVQRLLLDGLGVRLLAVADGRRRADQAPRRGDRDGPDQGGR